MDMRIDPTGKNQCISEVDFLTGSASDIGTGGGDHSVADRKCRVVTADNEIVITHGAVDRMRYPIG